MLTLTTTFTLKYTTDTVGVATTRIGDMTHIGIGDLTHPSGTTTIFTLASDIGRVWPDTGQFIGHIISGITHIIIRIISRDTRIILRIEILILKINRGKNFMQENLYIYKGVVTDLGFGIKVKQRYRLARVDTPEIRGEEREQGLYVTRIVEQLIEGKEVFLKSEKKGSFGRYLNEVNLSDHLLAENLAKVHEK